MAGSSVFRAAQKLGASTGEKFIASWGISMAGFTKFDPDAFLATAAVLQPSTLASLAALAGADRQNANPRPTEQKPIKYLQNENWTGTAAKPAKVAKVSSHPEVIVPAPWFDRLASRGPQETPFQLPDPAAAWTHSPP